MIVPILWKVFLSLLTVVMVIGFVINGSYGNTNVFGEKYPTAIMVVGFILLITIVSFIVAVIGSIWVLF